MRLCGQPPAWMLRLRGDPVSPVLNATSRALKGLGWARGLSPGHFPDLPFGLLSGTGSARWGPTVSL